ncbi:MAG: hypothetical protein V1712_02145 [Patescibacteria group bacterium]
MYNSEQSTPEGFIEDKDEARETAYAEKPARDFVADHKTELTPEQRQALEWFASSEGEEALAEFRNKKIEQQDIIRQKVWEFLDLQGMGNLTLQTEEADRYFLEKINEILKNVLKQQIDNFLAYEKPLSDKMGGLELARGSLIKGVRSYSKYMENHKLVFTAPELSSYNVDGKLSAAVADSNYKFIVQFLDHPGWKPAINEKIDKDYYIKKYLPYLKDGHKEPEFDKFMMEHNYIYNTKKEQYEQVE